LKGSKYINSNSQKV